MDIRILCMLFIMNSCISTKDYAKAESDRYDCLSGIKSPADGFCVKWNEKASKELDKLEVKLARTKVIKSVRRNNIETEINIIQTQRDTCFSKISKYY